MTAMDDEEVYIYVMKMSTYLCAIVKAYISASGEMINVGKSENFPVTCERIFMCEMCDL